MSQVFSQRAQNHLSPLDIHNKAGMQRTPGHGSSLAVLSALTQPDFKTSDINST